MPKNENKRFVGFDIGGTKCAICIASFDGTNLTILDKRQIPTDHSVSGYEMIDRMYLLARQMGLTNEIIGISCGGPLDSKRGIIQSPPNLPNWNNIEITKYLRSHHGISSYLENDANACAIAEWLFGAGKGSRNMVFLTFGTGMGAGLILDNKLYRGASSDAGEIGHIRLDEYGPVGYGKSGSFEGFCSGGGIAQLGNLLIKERKQLGMPNPFIKEEVTAKDLSILAKQGNKDALRIFEICGKQLGKGLAILIDILNPERIVIGSIYERSSELLDKNMYEMLKKECLRRSLRSCKIVKSSLGDQIGDYASICVAFYNQKGFNYVI